MEKRDIEKVSKGEEFKGYASDYQPAMYEMNLVPSDIIGVSYAPNGHDVDAFMCKIQQKSGRVHYLSLDTGKDSDGNYRRSEPNGMGW